MFSLARAALRGGTLIVMALCAALLPARAFSKTPGSGSLSRDNEPVLISGAALPELAGRPLSWIAVMTWDQVSQTYRPIPFQLDQRIAAVFNAGTQAEFTEVMYDVEHQGSGLLTALDELVFLYGDAGTARAPNAVPPPSQAEETMYELRIEDPRPNSNNPPRWAYVFSGSGLPRSTASYMTWNRAAIGSVDSDLFALDFTGRWLLTGLRVKAPCGSGADLIDRFKGRAFPLPITAEDEEGWNDNSSFLGGIVGPIRAIRYVRGANSAVNTIHHDVIYRGVWVRQVNLRVHALPQARFYVDWLPGSSQTLFLPGASSGFPIDGTPDGVPPSTAQWTITRSPRGGMATIYDIPPTPLLTRQALFQKDDRTWNDQITQNPHYGDEDNAAYGDSGFDLFGLADSQLDAIVINMRSYPLCANVGDAALGDSYNQLLQYPLQVTPQEVEDALAALTSVNARRDGRDVVLTWDGREGATGYRVYGSTFPNAPHNSWVKLSDVTVPTWRDVGAASAPTLRCYEIVALEGTSEGNW